MIEFLRTINKPVKVFFLSMLICMLLVPFLANDKAIFCFCNGKISIPVFQKTLIENQQHLLSCSYCLHPPIRYTAYQIDLNNSGYISPFETQNVDFWYQRHWLGTDKIGRDVAAGLLYGAGNSLLIGFFSMVIGLLLGVPTGMVLGYYQDNTISWNLVRIMIFFVMSGTLLFYLIFLPYGEWYNWLVLTLITGLFVTGFKLSARLRLKKYKIPVDLLGYRVLEWRKSIPALFLLLALLSLVSKPSVFSVILIIGLLAWADIARMVRAETLSVKTRPYVLSGIAMGMSHRQILTGYILPGLKDTIVVIAVYMFAGAILTESTLSFLGLGLPADEVSWGKMLAESRQARAWWMAVFPGICLVGLLFYLNKLANTKKNFSKLS